MANLLEIAETAWKQLFPNPSDETAISREEFIVTAKAEYAWQMQLYYWQEKQREGEFIMPSHLLTEVELPVVKNEMDISSLNVFRNLSSDIWLQNVGGIGCECNYVKTNINDAQLMCDDDSLGNDVKTYLPIGKKIKFPQGAHAGKVKIIYANKGERVDNKIEIDDGIAGIIRTRLIEIYGGKIGQEDHSNDSNSNSK